jgi:hypothetical protein
VGLASSPEFPHAAATRARIVMAVTVRQSGRDTVPPVGSMASAKDDASVRCGTITRSAGQ